MEKSLDKTKRIIRHTKTTYESSFWTTRTRNRAHDGKDRIMKAWTASLEDKNDIHDKIEVLEDHMDWRTRQKFR